MPSLQKHMYRVAGVAKIICDSLEVEIDADNVIKACLLHDMGNILKFKLDLYPQFLEPEGLEYWTKVKAEFQSKYGIDEHRATYMIAEDIGVDDRVMELIKSFGFSNLKEIWQSDDMAKKICNYSDMRVMPDGVASLVDRLEDGRKRFAINKPDVEWRRDSFEEFSNYAKQIEGQIFEKCSIRASNVTEQTIHSLIRPLENITINLQVVPHQAVV